MPSPVRNSFTGKEGLMLCSFFVLPLVHLVPKLEFWNFWSNPMITKKN